MSTDSNQNKVDSCTMKELVTFSHISPLYPAGTDVTIHYTLGAGLNATPVDWIGIVQNGEQDLSKVLVFQWAEVEQAGEGTSTIRSSTFPAKLLEPLAHQTQKYQFLYVSNRSLTRGSSQPFMIRSDSCGPDTVTWGPRSARPEAVSLAVNPCSSASSVTLSSEDEWELAAHSALQDEASGTTDLSDIVILSTSPSKETARAELVDKQEGWCEENLKSLSISTDDSPQDSYSDLGDVSKTDENNQTVEKHEELGKATANQGNYNKEMAREKVDQIKELRDKAIKKERKFLTNERSEVKSKRMKKPKYLKKVSHFEMSKPRKESDSSFIKKATSVVVSDQLTQVKSKCRTGDEEVSQAVKSCKHVSKRESAVLLMKQDKCLDAQLEEKALEALQVSAIHEVPKKELGVKQRKAKGRKENKNSEQPATFPAKANTQEAETENKSVVREEMPESIKSAIAFDEIMETKVAKKRKESHKLKEKTKEAVKKSQVAEISNETYADSADVKLRKVESLSKRDRELLKEARRVERMSRRVSKRQVLDENAVPAQNDYENEEDSTDRCVQNRWDVLSSVFEDNITAATKAGPQKIKSKKKDKTRAKHKQQYLKSLVIDLNAEMEFLDQLKHQTDAKSVSPVSTREGTEAAKIKEVLEVCKMSDTERHNTNGETEADQQSKKPVEEYAGDEHSSDRSPDKKMEIGDGSSSSVGLCMRKIGSFHFDPREALFTLGTSPERDRDSPACSRARSLSLAVRKAKYRHKSPASSSVHRTRVFRRWLCLKGRRERKESCDNILDREISSVVQPPSLNEEKAAISDFWNSLPPKASDQLPVKATTMPVSEELSWCTTSPMTLSAEATNSKSASSGVTKVERRPQIIGAFSGASMLAGSTDVSSPQKALPLTAPCLFQTPVAHPERTAANILTSGLQDSGASQKVLGTVGDGLPSYASVLKRSKQGIYPQIDTGSHAEVSLRNDLPSNVDKSLSSVKSAHQAASSSENILYKLPDICSEETPCIRFDTKYQDDLTVKSPDVLIREFRETPPEGAEGVSLGSREISLSEIVNYLPKSATGSNNLTECRIKRPTGFENTCSLPRTFGNGFNEVKYLSDISLFSERMNKTADIETPLIWPLAGVVCPSVLGSNFPRFQVENETPIDMECEAPPTDKSLFYRAGSSTMVDLTPFVLNDDRSAGRYKECKNLMKCERSRSGCRHHTPDRHQDRRWSGHEDGRLLKNVMEIKEARHESMTAFLDQRECCQDQPKPIAEHIDWFSTSREATVRHTPTSVSKPDRRRHLSRSNVEILSLKSKSKESDSRIAQLEDQLNALRAAFHKKKHSRKSLTMNVKCLKLQVKIKDRNDSVKDLETKDMSSNMTPAEDNLETKNGTIETITEESDTAARADEIAPNQESGDATGETIDDSIEVVSHVPSVNVRSMSEVPASSEGISSSPGPFTVLASGSFEAPNASRTVARPSSCNYPRGNGSLERSLSTLGRMYGLTSKCTNYQTSSRYYSPLVCGKSSFPIAKYLPFSMRESLDPPMNCSQRSPDSPYRPRHGTLLSEATPPNCQFAPPLLSSTFHDTQRRSDAGYQTTSREVPFSAPGNTYSSFPSRPDGGFRSRAHSPTNHEHYPQQFFRNTAPYSTSDRRMTQQPCVMEPTESCFGRSAGRNWHSETENNYLYSSQAPQPRPLASPATNGKMNPLTLSFHYSLGGLEGTHDAMFSYPAGSPTFYSQPSNKSLPPSGQCNCLKSTDYAHHETTHAWFNEPEEAPEGLQVECGPSAPVYPQQHPRPSVPEYPQQHPRPSVPEYPQQHPRPSIPAYPQQHHQHHHKSRPSVAVHPRQQKQQQQQQQQQQQKQQQQLRPHNPTFFQQQNYQQPQPSVSAYPPHQQPRSSGVMYPHSQQPPQSYCPACQSSYEPCDTDGSQPRDSHCPQCCHEALLAGGNQDRHEASYKQSSDAQRNIGHPMCHGHNQHQPLPVNQGVQPPQNFYVPCVCFHSVYRSAPPMATSPERSQHQAGMANACMFCGHVTFQYDQGSTPDHLDQCHCDQCAAPGPERQDYNQDWPTCSCQADQYACENCQRAQNPHSLPEAVARDAGPNRNFRPINSTCNNCADPRQIEVLRACLMRGQT